MKRKAIISVTNDLFHDQRVHKVSLFLKNTGIDVILLGRKLKNSEPIIRPYRTHRMHLIFNKNVWFYAEYNIRLFFYLLFHKTDILVANDLDTLPANYIISRLKNIPLYYDTHEFFIGVPELQQNKFAKFVWTKIESYIFPKLKNVYTVNTSIAGLYKEMYGNSIQVVRNIPSLVTFPKVFKTRVDLGLPLDKKIVILQGAGINIDRGAEEAVEAMKYLQNTILLIAGSGDVIDSLKVRVNKENLNDKVIFKDKMLYDELIQYTANSDLGLTLDKDNNLNYRYSLPNKLFDYIHAGIPVLSSNLIELKNIIHHYQIGLITPSHDPKVLSDKITEALLDDKQKQWRINLKRAYLELNWEKEEKVLKQIYNLPTEIV